LSRGKSSTNRFPGRKFTRIPKAQELVGCGVPLYAMPTYLALSDHACNKTGRTFVAVEKVAEILKVCRRTVERHLAALERAGVIRRQFQRRTSRGRFSSCLCVVISFALFAVRHPATSRPRRASNRRTKRLRNHPPNPPGGTKEAREKRKAQQRARRREGYEWLFGEE
jgi:DNA-binding transcriptional ArsR family regulator